MTQWRALGKSQLCSTVDGYITLALLSCPQSSLAVKRARSLGMAPQNFLDNLEHLRVVTSVALEHVQDNRGQFARSGTGIEGRRAEKAISQLRVLMMQLEKEFTILQYLLADDASVAAPPRHRTTNAPLGPETSPQNL